MHTSNISGLDQRALEHTVDQDFKLGAAVREGNGDDLAVGKLALDEAVDRVKDDSSEEYEIS